MQQLVEEFSAAQKKAKLVDVRSGDTVRVHQRIREGSKTRTQVFEGLVIRIDRLGSLTARLSVRRIASGVGVEKSFLLHSPLIEKVEVIKRSRVRRNYLSYMRSRSGKSARLSSVEFDREGVNAANIEAQRSAAEAESGADEAPAEDKPAVESDSVAEETEAKAEETAETPTAKPTAPTEAKPEPGIETAKAKADEPAEDKAKSKKAKAEAFRQAHEK